MSTREWGPRKCRTRADGAECQVGDILQGCHLNILHPRIGLALIFYLRLKSQASNTTCLGSIDQHPLRHGCNIAA